MVIQVVYQVLVENFIFACGIHFFQFLEDCLGSASSDVWLGYQEIGLEVVFGYKCVVVEGDVDSCEDEVFRKLCIGSVGWSDKYSGTEQPKIVKKSTFFAFPNQ